MDRSNIGENLRKIGPGNLGDVLCRHADADGFAIIDLLKPEEAKKFTYSALHGIVDGVADFLVSFKLPRGTRIAILSLNRVEHVATYLGIMKAGMVAVPVNIKLPKATTDYIMADSGVAFAFVDAAHAGIATSIPSINFDDDGPSGFAARIIPARFDAVQPVPNETAQILYTSGSTGVPKGVPLTHSGMLWALDGVTRPGAQAERQILAQPLFHMNGLMVVKSALRNGSSIVIMPSFEARSYAEALVQWGVTRIFAVPTMLARVLRETEGWGLDFSRVSAITLSSAPTTEALIHKVAQAFPAAAVDVSYGCTEAGPLIFGKHPSGLAKPMLALGASVDGCEIRLEEGTPDQGVLLIRNPAVMPGYLNLPGKTAEVLHDGWYRSGDVVRCDQQGFYYFVGRVDDMFVCSGENIYPGDVEKMLEKHDAIHQVAVVPLPDEERGQMPAAFIVLHKDEELTVEDVKSFALLNGPAYQHPRRVAFVAELPWAGTNKIDRKALAGKAIELEREKRWSR
ncbi:MAG: acyl--CoA ligase [Hyphomonadaceae bacterium]|nr:acyl--CoA ligase [Hyphomonadaceae bacterium]